MPQRSTFPCIRAASLVLFPSLFPERENSYKGGFCANSTKNSAGAGEKVTQWRAYLVDLSTFSRKIVSFGNRWRWRHNAICNLKNPIYSPVYARKIPVKFPARWKIAVEKLYFSTLSTGFSTATFLCGWVDINLSTVTDFFPTFSLCSNFTRENFRQENFPLDKIFAVQNSVITIPQSALLTAPFTQGSFLI